jgi:hypothetical protein
MIFWFAILLCMLVSNLLTLTIAVIAWKWHEERKLTRIKIERGAAAFEHLMSQQRTPPPPVPFPKKAE